MFCEGINMWRWNSGIPETSNIGVPQVVNEQNHHIRLTFLLFTPRQSRSVQYTGSRSSYTCRLYKSSSVKVIHNCTNAKNLLYFLVFTASLLNHVHYIHANDHIE